MASISVSDLQEIAVKCTSDFLNSGISLNQGLAKMASEKDLNPEQLRRAVEATNTLTYLKSIEVTGDRTSEFPLAEYGQILKMASIPEAFDVPQQVKSASLMEESNQTWSEKRAGALATQEVEAEASLQYSFPLMEKQALQAFFIKEAHANARRVEFLQAEGLVLAQQLVKLASEVKADPLGLEKLSCAILDPAHFKKVSCLVYGTPRESLDFVGEMTKSASFRKPEFLKAAEELSDKLILAEEIQAELQKRSGLQKQAEEMQKEAFLGALAGTVAKGIGSGVGKAIGGTASLAGSGIKMIGKGLAGAVKAPLKVGGAKIQNWAANTTKGKDLGIPTITPSKKALSITAAGMAAGGAAMDASMFKPQVDPAKDRSGSVWEALQG
jgi:hypothetical protein